MPVNPLPSRSSEGTKAVHAGRCDAVRAGAPAHQVHGGQDDRQEACPPPAGGQPPPQHIPPPTGSRGRGPEGDSPHGRYTPSHLAVLILSNHNQ